VKAAQAHGRDLVRRGRTVIGGLAEPLAPVERRDGSTGPWRNGLDPRSLTIELTALRAAAYVFIAAISGMRDSEIQELQRGCLTVGYAGPVLRSRKWKHSDGRPATWAVIDPVARAIEVLERLSRHETHLFAPSFTRAGSTRRAGIEANHDIEVFITDEDPLGKPGNVVRLLRVGFEVRLTVELEEAGHPDVEVTVTRATQRHLRLEEGLRVWVAPTNGARTQVAGRVPGHVLGQATGPVGDSAPASIRAASG